jgi:protein gp37
VSKIEWTRNADGTEGKTWNPTLGCSKCSEGCDNCYPIDFAHRGLIDAHKGLTVRTPSGLDWTGEVRTLPERLDVPRRWRKPQRVFVDSMSDLFHPEVPDEFIVEVWRVMRSCPQHTFQILTKRPRRMAAFVARLDEDADGQLYCRQIGDDPAGIVLDNVWLGTSIESDRWAGRAAGLRATPAAVRFISAEPLLSALPSLNLHRIDWVIAGGESGRRARPMHPAWPRELRDRCAASGTAFFFKQFGEWGELPPGWPGPGCMANRSRAHVVAYDGRHWPEHELAIRYLDDDGQRWAMGDRPFEHAHETGRQLAREDPGRLRLHVMHRVGKKAAGRELDGRTWDDMPGTNSAVAR